ncbi:aldose 1-epimerase family protein [Lyngbya aestuarii BL J]|uniref:Aldose 1-epimerase family protein n=3 Tax=Lyngbya aestuarii TaxID=118322 RepID=U7QKN2_9CYAN|nr:aldose 1-epimerase [Lyngbya aestuarii]ERT07847.1 aldose 1-epimerase family protein [Lyngbya aestuarii BL J]
MPAVTLKQQQYQTYILSDETISAEVSVVPERGGIITDWRIGEHQIFYLDTERFTDPSLSVRGGIPLLFPICGNLPNDTYTLNGKTYQLKQHGFARNLPWEVTEQSTEKGASLTVTLKSNDQTRAVYPFDFELNFIYTLRGNTLELRYRHTNLSQESMPFSTGIHPYFTVANKQQLVFDLPSTQFQAKDDETIQTFSGQFDFEQDEIDVAFFNLSKSSAVVNDLSRKLKLTFEWDNRYSTLVFWTVKGKEFYCLEPWSSPRNALNTGKSLMSAKPGETIETFVKISADLG